MGIEGAVSFCFFGLKRKIQLIVEMPIMNNKCYFKGVKHSDILLTNYPKSDFEKIGNCQQFNWLINSYQSTSPDIHKYLKW